MSTTSIAPAMTSVLASARVQATDEPGGEATLPPVIRDAQGREYRLQVDPVSGMAQYRHASIQRDQAGSSLALEILITLADDGSFTRKTTQDLQLATGDSQREVVDARFAADGVQVGETVDSTTRRGKAVTTEHTVGSFVAGQLVKRESDIVQRDEATDPKTGEHVTVEGTIRGVWDGRGEPITDATVPFVDRTDTQRIDTPGQGLHKDTPRVITFTAHGAGPLGALDWDDAGKLVVRFEGNKNQYIEREMRVPLDQASGAPLMDQAEVTRTEDGQNFLNKSLMQARIWGGFASNLSWVIGLNFARGSLGKGFLGLSAAAAAAQLTGEVHAVATKRNDGDVTRVVTSAYDMLLTGMLAAYMSGRKDAAVQLPGAIRTGATAAGATGIAINAAELGASGLAGTQSLMDRLGDSRTGAALAGPDAKASSGRLIADAGWRSEPRFDAARALLAA